MHLSNDVGKLKLYLEGIMINKEDGKSDWQMKQDMLKSQEENDSLWH